MLKSSPSPFFLLVLIFANIACKKSSTLFEQIPSSTSNITFKNKLTETEKRNILSYEYFYNGAGLASGDFNNDGKIDLYFAGNQVDSKLYLNNTEGEIEFKEINCGITGKKEAWKTGVSVVDINNDGWLDIYQCYSGIGSNESRKNQLFVNQGLKGKEWASKFVEEAEKYGIADAGYTTQATFFDYDVDGDLDLFVLNHNLKNYERKEASVMKSAVDSLAGDRLYRNDNQHFTDVTQAAGILSNPLGFGLGLAISDFNQDNLPDIYVANDYVEEDYLYLNKGKGKFEEVGKKSMGHFSYSSMGVDAADVNNDGLPDVFTADMLPEDNRRQKLLAFPDNWNVQKSMLENGFHWQNMRNMLQVNKGNSGIIPKFSEIGQLSGVAATDWSWAPLFADFDNDGFKDLFVSNGFVRDLTDLDFVKYFLDEESKKNQNLQSATLLEQVKKMPATPTHHYIFKNNGDLTFTNKVTDWGFEQQTIASGAIYADLDNDGDLEIITNNTNEPARVYKNNQQENTPQNYLKVQLKGDFYSGAKVIVYTNKNTQFIENQTVHGFQSSIAGPINFGIGENKIIDSVKVVWGNGGMSLVKNPKINELLDIENSEKPFPILSNSEEKTIFTETQIIDFSQKENDFIDFNRQILLPKFYSRPGPKMAKGDVNGDGLDDIFICTPIGQSNALFIQNINGTFNKSAIWPNVKIKLAENIDAVFIDVDHDKDLDLYIINGGYEQPLEDKINEDELFLNDGKGKFTKSKGSIPTILTNKSSIKASDFDNDGDQDIFLAGGVRAGLYPYQDPSYFLKNDGMGNFTIAQKFETDLISDFVITDIDNDKYADIVLVGEFSPINILKNIKGKFSQKTNEFIPVSNGWYNRIVAEDLDNDGDTDFIIGNLGENTPLKASDEKPLQLYFGDADGNGTVDPFIGNYSGENAYPIAGRDEALEQMVGLRKKFNNYSSYSTAIIDDLFEKEYRKNITVFKIYNLKSGIIWNENGKFIWTDLPKQAQTAPIYAIAVDDFNHDKIKDILLAGNNSNFRLRIGKTDANLGGIFLGNKNKTFTYMSQKKAGLFVNGDVKDIVKINNTYLLGVNNGKMLAFKIENK
jgi:enediyne biosynthesis protein E4